MCPLPTGVTQWLDHGMARLVMLDADYLMHLNPFLPQGNQGLSPSPFLSLYFLSRSLSLFIYCIALSLLLLCPRDHDSAGPYHVTCLATCTQVRRLRGSVRPTSTSTRVSAVCSRVLPARSRSRPKAQKRPDRITHRTTHHRTSHLTPHTSHAHITRRCIAGPFIAISHSPAPSPFLPPLPPIGILNSPTVAASTARTDHECRSCDSNATAQLLCIAPSAMHIRDQRNRTQSVSIPHLQCAFHSVFIHESHFGMYCCNSVSAITLQNAEHLRSDHTPTYRQVQ